MDITRLREQALNLYFKGLNSMQRQAALSVDGPLLILAGAGSGKTTVLINRIQNMVLFGDALSLETKIPPQGEEVIRRYIDGGDVSPMDLSIAMGAAPIKPWNILAITFTNKAAGELKQRLASSLGDVGGSVHASTFHSMCAMILRRDIDVLGYSSSFTIYDSDDSQRLLKECIRSVQLDEKLFVPKVVLSAISRAKDQMITPKQKLDEAGSDYREQCIAKIYAQYQKQLKAANALDFDDIIMLTVRLFQEHPGVLEKYQDRYRYIMVDEYQDTNHAQYLLISLLSEKYRNLCVVGDDDQSIYKFRGATIENILSFEQQYPDAKVVRLEENYRSTQNILDAANRVIENNKGRKGKNLWTGAGSGEKVQFHRLRDEVEESRFICDRVLEHVRSGGNFSDCAVLYRINAMSNALERALTNSAIPYRIIGGLRFYERKEIKDMTAYLTVLENPGDALRLLRVIGEPKRGIGTSTIQAAQQIADGIGATLFEVISQADQYPTLSKKSAPLIAFANLITELSADSRELPLPDLLDAVLDRTGYRAMLESQGFEGAGRLENIMELKTNLVRYDQQTEQPSLAGFLEEIALYTDLDNYDADADAMVLMTIHSAKGLEFPWVAIAGMDEGIFPGRSAMSSDAEIEEERRLAYVAITRAKSLLNITSAERRMIFGQTVFSRPSRFVAEIPSEFIEVTDQVSANKPLSAPSSRPSSVRGAASSGLSIGIGAPAAKSAPNAKNAQVFGPGDTVEHSTFGLGRVLSARPMGNDTLVEIQFDKAGLKKVMANFARLTVVK